MSLDWITETLVCPFDLAPLYRQGRLLSCMGECGRQYGISPKGIPMFDVPPFDRREYLFEAKRYDNVALEKPDEWGLDETQPEKRAEYLKGYMDGRSGPDVPSFLTIGPGFGQLEKLMPNKKKFCLDQSLGFLKVLQKENLPNIYFINGFAEKMPFPSNIFPCVVSDSVFQTMTEQREFLIECARVLKPDGLFLLATTYTWNYPRKPQLFPAKEGELLKKFLHELGIGVYVEYINLKNPHDKVTYDEGEYLLVRGFKYSNSLGWEP